MPDDAADEIDEVDPELHELVALLRHLTAGTGGVCDAQPKLVHEYVDGAGPHDQQLACGDPATARAADLHPVAQLRDRVLDLTASRRALDVLVAVPRWSTQVGHGEAGIVPSRAAHASNDLGLNHNTPRLPPGGGRLATFAVDELSSAVCPRCAPAPVAWRPRRTAPALRLQDAAAEHDPPLVPPVHAAAFPTPRATILFAPTGTVPEAVLGRTCHRPCPCPRVPAPIDAPTRGH